MSEIRDIDVVVFDVLGTLVDQQGGLRAAIRGALPDADATTVDELLTKWRQHVEREQQRIMRGHRLYANSDVLDAEAARRVADHAGLTDPAPITRLATAGRRLPAWDDSIAGLDRLACRLRVFALSDSAHTALPRLNAHAGLRWHQALSGETVGAYKPAREVYRLAIDTAGCPPHRVLMVAAYAWDLRGAQAQGMRTAHIKRPTGDAPAVRDVFDGNFAGLTELASALNPRE